MADVALRNVVKRLRRGSGRARRQSDIPDKEFVVLVGPSGCGKSTTLRMIAGLEEISAGDILIGGDVVNDVPPRDRDIAMVFQNYALYPHMTVFENMSFGLKLRRVKKRRNSHAGRAGRANPRHHRSFRPPSEAALGRPAPARRHGPRHCAQSEGVPVRRAAVQSRRQAARADADRNQARAPEGQDDDDLRNPRPGRGDDSRRSSGGDERRPHRAGRHAARTLSSPTHSASSRASSARRR